MTGTRSRVRISLSFIVCGCVLAIPDAAGASYLDGQIVVDPDHPEWMKRQGGGPGDPEGFLYLGARNADGTRSGGSQSDIINQMKGTGANCLYLMAIRSHGGDGDDTENPFVDFDATKPLDQDILDQWEGWFTEMDDNGIAIYLFFYDDAIDVASNLSWPLDGDGNLHPTEKSFIQGIVDEFEHHENLVWCVMEEVEEMGSDYVEHAKKIAEAIRQADDHDHIIACHQLTGTTFIFPDDPNIDQFAMQIGASSPGDLHGEMLTAWNAANGRYSLNMAETAYHKGLIQNGERTELRRANWATAMGGAYIMVIGTWTSGTPTNDMLRDCGRLVQFFESTNFNTMAPHDELAHGGTQWVLASPGQSYIAYASNLSGEVGIKGMAAGTYDFKWVDCATGGVASQTGISVSAGDRTWPKPGGIGTELAVWITRTGEAGGDGGKSTSGGCVPSTGGSLCCLALACLAAKAACHAGRTESPLIPPRVIQLFHSGLA